LLEKEGFLCFGAMLWCAVWSPLYPAFYRLRTDKNFLGEKKYEKMIAFSLFFVFICAAAVFPQPKDTLSTRDYISDSTTLPIGGTYEKTPYEKVIDPNGITTEYVRCPDPTSNLVAKITRTMVGAEKKTQG